MPPSQPLSDSRTPSLDELCETAVSLQVAGRLDVAAGMYRDILLAQPLHAAANHCFGILLMHLKRPGDGLPHLLTALTENPQVPDYWLGCLEGLLLIDKRVEAGNLLAIARQNGLAGPPFDDFAQRLAAKPAQIATPAPAPSAPAPSAPARREKPMNPRRAEKRLEEMFEQSRHVEALALARDLTQRHPGRGYAWKALGVLTAVKRDAEGALEAMFTAVQLMPRDPEALRNLGVTLYEAGRFIEAESFLRRALEIEPNSARLHNDLGVTLSQQSRVAESVTEFRRAVALTAHESTPDSDLPRSSLLLGLSYDASVDAETLFAEHCKVGRHIEGPRRSWPAHSNDRDPDRRLQVGLVSGDFWDHSVTNFVEPVLAQLRRFESLELHAYDNNEIDDAVNARLRGHLPHWRKVLRLSDQQLAQQIRDDGIDILIDLSGHTSRHRLRTFARKPAPIQVSWLGYPGTTGLRAMDYFLADRHFLPLGKFDRHFTEKIVRLNALAPFQPHERAPPVNRLPALETGCIRFGSFNQPSKINDAAIGLWAKLLQALPTASMLLAGLGQENQQHRMTEGFAAHGITGDRLTFQRRCGMETYLALHHQVDMCLDTTPYTGGTTTCHALWMGVPTLTLAGPTPASRQSAAIQEAIGLDGFSAQSAADFVERGLYWSNHLAALAELRSGLRARCEQAPGRQPAAIVAGLDCALRHMWRRWCANLPAESFEVPAPVELRSPSSPTNP